MSGFSVLQLTFLFVALSGFIVTTNVNSSPTFNSFSSVFNVTLSTFIISGSSGSGSVTSSSFTVTVQVAVFCPSSVVTVISVVPSAIAVTTPLSSTVAIFEFSVLQLTFLFVALSGFIVATNVNSSPTFNSFSSVFNVTLSTFIISGSSGSPGSVDGPSGTSTELPPTDNS